MLRSSSMTLDVNPEDGATRMTSFESGCQGVVKVQYALAPVEATFGSVARELGVLAATADRAGAAAEHYEAAIAVERRMRATPWLARAKRELAALR
jgi:hypothetical protein